MSDEGGSTFDTGSRPLILALTPYFLPGFRGGGPIRSLSAMAGALEAEFDFRIVTGDRDCGDAAPYVESRRRGWSDACNVRVWYVPPGGAGWPEICALMRQGQKKAVYLNDLFSATWGLWPSLLSRLGLVPGSPLLIAPRGQLSAGALSVKSAKKRSFLRFARMTTWFQTATWHATSDAEVEEIRRIAGSKATVYLAPNIPGVTPDTEPEQKACDEMTERRTPVKLVFVSRIVPKKNLRTAIRILSRVSAPVSFDVFGPIEDEAYWLSVKNDAGALPANVTFRYRGVLRPEEAEIVCRSYDAFLFPTLGENFGHVIYEALAVGCLPILSDRTPWLDVGRRRCGWICSLDDEKSFADAVEELCRLSPVEAAEMRKNARAYAAHYLSGSEAVSRTRAMFRAVFSGSATQRSSRRSDKGVA